MASEVLQRKIKTTQDLRDIVSNMKTLSSVSILQYEQANTVLDKYQRNLRDAFQVLAIHNGMPQIKSQKTPNKRHLFVLIGSDNGMVGKFNREVTEKVSDFIKEQKIAKKDTYFITIGKRLSALAEQAGFNILNGFATSNSVKAVIDLTETVLMHIEKAISKSRITDIYTCCHYRNGSAGISTEMKKILPVENAALQKLKHKKWETNNVPMMPVDNELMFKALTYEMLMITIARHINSSLSAEHYTRMTNMQNAEKNIDENLEEMNLLYQQQRQEEITNELIDVISGANAMQEKSKS